MFQGPKRRPNDLEIYEHQFLERKKTLGRDYMDYDEEQDKHVQRGVLNQ